MAPTDGDGDALATVEVIYPDGRTNLLSLEFPTALSGGQWVGINICECGGRIRYDWDENHAFRKAACPTCGIVFVVKDTRH